MQPIVNRGDASDDPAVAAGEEERDVRVREKRILARRQLLDFAEAERRNPARVGAVAIVLIVDELPELALSCDRTNLWLLHAACTPPPGGLPYQEWPRSTTYTSRTESLTRSVRARCSRRIPSCASSRARSRRRRSGCCCSSSRISVWR